MSQKKKIGVFVLGPLDRSPRMLNHTISLGEFTKFDVDFIGYKGSSMPQKLQEYKDNIHIVPIDTSVIDSLKSLPKVFYLFYVFARIVVQIAQLFLILIRGNYDYVLMQNPPCIPIMMVITVYRWTQRALLMEPTKLVIDWHNYGYTIMEANNVNPALVALGKMYERFFGLFGHQHLTVSNAFKKDLAEKFGIPLGKISVLYDRAVAGKFKQLTLKEKHELFGRIELEEVFTNKDGSLKDSRPILLITSTSYTPDEDLGLFIKALEKYAQKSMKDPKMAKLHVIVTGAGPQKKMFIQEFKKFTTKYAPHVKIEAKWLEIDDYPKMVAAADLGVCMHMSSSNLDLPMKVVDMFSSKLPCFAYDYPTIGELVEAEENGCKKPNGALFKDENRLFHLLESHFGQGVEAGINNVEKYRKNLDTFVNETWEDHWREIMLD